MNYHFQKGTNPSKPVLLLLHGTGGNEFSMMQIAEMIDPEASVLSVRGNVLENGMPRFFRRLSEGVFDLEDLYERTEELKNFLEEAADTCGFDREHIVAAGYSNGANIAGSLLFQFGKVLKGAVLFHPMVPRRDMELPNMAGLPVFIGAGTNDPLCSPEESQELNKMLQEQGADVKLHWESFGHQLTAQEVEAAAAWYKNIWG
ncbi:alpha/beta hydrolase [Metabacillus sp. GX 13764]|uniref:alpha/beta hydrolase n=1 Tax=Metabacillus kandeliae TaxID=2900151 RepID=UPI001E4D46F5|nr:alpha/beta hydrolase [Metabacillus kandeliae]MCD7035912.1 alpha/beta hydrolase [Metabacillus kandeliae]